MTEPSVRDSAVISMSEEELAIMQMALMRGMNSSNRYFKERCGELLYRILDDLSSSR